MNFVAQFLRNQPVAQLKFDGDVFWGAAYALLRIRRA